MKIGIALVNKSAVRAVQQALEQDGGHEVLWTVGGGDQALERMEAQCPDLLLLDACMTHPDCVEVTRQSVERNGPAILLLADRPQEQMFRVYDAMGLGALDVVASPALTASGGLTGGDAFLAKIRTVIKILGLSVGRAGRPSARPSQRARGLPKIVAIGASTGGPQAIFQILSELPPQLRAAVVVVQHVESEFSAGFGAWLQQGTQMRVELARPGSAPAQGTVLLAASNDHLIMSARGTFTYTSDPKETPYRPSVDALFRSLAQHWTTPGVAVLLTGMGRDGAHGMKQLRDARWHTIAQDEASSIVFGMPKAAIELGAAERVAPLSEMAELIVRACS